MNQLFIISLLQASLLTQVTDLFIFRKTLTASSKESQFFITEALNTKPNSQKQWN